MYGAGNIGRGFIGALFSASGYRVVFIDVSRPVIDALNRDGHYPIRILSGDAYEDVDVKNVCAVDGTDPVAVAEAIASADLMATAVGVNVLPKITPNIVAGFRLRKEQGRPPLNFLICENLMDANQVLNEMISSCLTAEEQVWFSENIGLVETSIGRMVPVQTEEMKDGNPLRVCVERYDTLPVDKDGFRGEIPAVKNMIPYTPFDFYVKRKLYIHNLGHAITAYLGDILGLEYISDAIAKQDVYVIVKGAMTESARALFRKYGADFTELSEHIDDLLYRFTNAALQDTCKRVGGDPKRKLAPKDRLVGAATTVLEEGETPSFIALGIAAALCRYCLENDVPFENVTQVLFEVCGLCEDNILTRMILEDFAALRENVPLSELYRQAVARQQVQTVDEG